MNNTIIELLKIAINGKENKKQYIKDINWFQLLELAVLQGVKGLVWNGIQIQRKAGLLHMDMDSLMEWYGQIRNMEIETSGMYKKSVAIANQIGGKSRLVVLKGIDYAQFWPNPLHREFCDLDIYSGDCFEKINERAIQCGMEVKWHGYKHTHILYCHFLVENHKCFTGHNNTTKGFLTETYLKELLAEKPLSLINDSCLSSPPPMFTAVFLLVHAQYHFMSEGLIMRQILDWYFFLKKYSSQLNWQKLKVIYRETGLIDFYNMLTAYCEKVLGLNMPVEYGRVSPKFLQNVNNDVFLHKSMNIPSKTLVQKSKSFCRRINRIIKYKCVLKESLTKTLYNMVVYGFFKKQIYADS